MRFMTWIKKFTQSQRGSVMPLVALGIFALVGATGTAIDMGRVQIVQSRLQTALDGAGLAAGASILSTDPNTQALNYFNANFPASYLGANVHDWTVTVASDNVTINLSVQATVPTTFMKLFGTNSVTATATTQITRQTRGMELVLVMDNTGSMAQPAGGSISKIQAAQTAAASLLSILYGSNNTVPNLWVGVVPFSQAVNIGTGHASWVDNSNNFNFGPIANTVAKTCSPYNGTAGVYAAGPTCTYQVPTASTEATFGQINWAGCVESRSNGVALPQYDITDDPPSVKLFKPYYYASGGYDNWLSYNGNTQSCKGGSGGVCTASHTVQTTCNYPACCPPGAESCTNPVTNPPNSCGKTYSCTQQVCDARTPVIPPVCNPTGSQTTYNYSLNTTYLDTYQGPNAYCPQPIQPMVAEKNTVIAALNSMQPTGETEIDLGLAWGWRLLSPRWQGLWGGEMNANSLPLAYNTPLMSKVVILMTDGDNNIASGYYSAYGLTSSAQLGPNACTGTDCTKGIGVINTRTTNGKTGVCDLMKAQGIIIYTVALGALVDGTAQTMLQNCATNPSYFFLSPTTNELQGIFQQIGESLANLRISQ